MLTESERQWAVNAKMRMSHKNDFCCGKCGVHCYVPYAPCFCVMTKDDVAWEIEFQSRVAAKLADIDFSPVADTRPCVRLKYARLQAEEEMDADIQAKDKAI